MTYAGALSYRRDVLTIWHARDLVRRCQAAGCSPLGGAALQKCGGGHLHAFLPEEAQRLPQVGQAVADVGPEGHGSQGPPALAGEGAEEGGAGRVGGRGAAAEAREQSGHPPGRAGLHGRGGEAAAG